MLQAESCIAVDAVLSEYSVLKGKDAAFHVHYWGANGMHYDNPVHRHSFHEVCYVVDGTGTYMDDQTEFEIKPNMLFISRPGVWHQIRSQEGLFVLYVAFELNEAESSPETVALYRKLEHTGAFIQYDASAMPLALIWQGLFTQAGQAKHLAADTLASLAHALLCSILHTFQAKQESEKEQVVKLHPSKTLHQAKMFIRDNLLQPLMLADVASCLHISERHLSRLFSEHEGQTYISYVRQERIRHAVSQLKTTNHSIKEIAEQAGFESVHYFTRVFTEMKGMPPGKFREASMKAESPQKEDEACRTL